MSERCMILHTRPAQAADQKKAKMFVIVEIEISIK